MKRAWKVFSGVNWCYCYSKREALIQRTRMQEAGYTKVMIKGRKL